MCNSLEQERNNLKTIQTKLNYKKDQLKEYEQRLKENEYQKEITVTKQNILQDNIRKYNQENYKLNQEIQIQQELVQNLEAAIENEQS